MRWPSASITGRFAISASLAMRIRRGPNNREDWLCQFLFAVRLPAAHSIVHRLLKKLDVHPSRASGRTEETLKLTINNISARAELVEAHELVYFHSSANQPERFS